MITNEDNIVLNTPLIYPSAPLPENENIDYNLQQHQILYNQANIQNPTVNILQPNPSDCKAQFQKRLIDNYPTRTIFTLCAILLISNVIIFLLEVTYRSFLPNNKENLYKTMVVSKYLAYAAFANIIYAILGFISGWLTLIFNLPAFKA
jgi:hypothetical protein